MKDGDFHSPKRLVFAPEASDATHRVFDCDRRNKSRACGAPRARRLHQVQAVAAKIKLDALDDFEPPWTNWTSLIHVSAGSSATLRFDKRVSTFPKSRRGTGSGRWCKHQQLHCTSSATAAHCWWRHFRSIGQNGSKNCSTKKDIIFEVRRADPRHGVARRNGLRSGLHWSRCRVESKLPLQFLLWGTEQIILLAQRFDRFPRRQICPELCTCAASSGHLVC